MICGMPGWGGCSTRATWPSERGSMGEGSCEVKSHRGVRRERGVGRWEGETHHGIRGPHGSAPAPVSFGVKARSNLGDRLVGTCVHPKLWTNHPVFLRALRSARQ